MAAPQPNPADSSVWAGIPYSPDVTMGQIHPELALQPEAPSSTATLPQRAMEQGPVGSSSVFAPTPKPDPLQSQEDEIQRRLQGNYWKDQNPYGSPDNHPGKLGHVLHALSVAGNIAGDIFAPSTMALIPGTQLNRRVQEGQEQQGIRGIEAEKGENAERAATTAHTEAETAGIPAESAARTNEANARADALNNAPTPQGPDLAHAYGTAVQKAIAEGRDPMQDPVVQHLSDAITSIQRQPQPKTEPERQTLIDEYMKTHPHATRAEADTAASAALQAPQRAPIIGVPMFVTGPNGESTLQVVHPGQSVAPGAQTAAGLNTTNTPTAQMRNTAQRAELVHQMVPEVLSNIDQNAKDLGPVMGRWNDFMQGRVGTDNPQFAQLRADLLLLSSSVALAHAQGRLPENLREEFDQMINAPKQTPENLKSVIKEIDKAMVLNTQVMGGARGGSAPQGAPPPGATIRDYTQLGGPK
ncbi:MAG: hypothetical protein WBQ94_03490 [Terracidiphilus sp.]